MLSPYIETDILFVSCLFVARDHYLIVVNTWNNVYILQLILHLMTPDKHYYQGLIANGACHIIWISCHTVRTTRLDYNISIIGHSGLSFQEIIQAACQIHRHAEGSHVSIL